MQNHDYWYPWYPVRFRRKTIHLSRNERWAYRDLIDWYMETGDQIPNNIVALANICGMSVDEWSKISANVLDFFEIIDDHLIHKKCEFIMADQADRASVRSENAAAAASKKWENSRGLNTTKRSQRLSEARKKGTHTKSEWLSILETCDWKCVKCQSKQGLVKDHINPIYKGGSDSIDNIQPLCRSCNSAKGPENKDFRPSNWKERLPNACQTPAKRVQSAATEQNITSQDKRESLPSNTCNNNPPSPLRRTMTGIKDGIWKGRASIILKTATLEEARKILPNADVYTIEADWKASGKDMPDNPDKAFIGYCRGVAKNHPELSQLRA